MEEKIGNNRIWQVLDGDDPERIIKCLQQLLKNCDDISQAEILPRLQTLSASQDIGIRFWAKKLLEKLGRYSKNSEGARPEAVKAAKSAVSSELPVDLLVKKLQTVDSTYVSLEVIEKLCLSRNPAAFSFLKGYLLKCQDVYQISFLTKSIGLNFPGNESIQLLLPFLKHSDDRVVGNTIEGLENIDDPQGVVAISRLLKHPGNRVQINAAKALSRLKPDTAFAALSSMLKPETPAHFQISACHAVKILKDCRYAPMLEDLLLCNHCFPYALSALKEISPSLTAEILAKNLDRFDAEKRELVLPFLEKIGGTRLQPASAKTTASEDAGGEKTPPAPWVMDELKEDARSDLLNPVQEFWRQRQLILSEPELMIEDKDSQLKIRPLKFAIQGLFGVSLIINSIGFFMHHEGAAQNTRTSVIFNGLDDFIPAFFQILTAFIFRFWVVRMAGNAKRAQIADRIYLFYVTSRLFIVNMCTSISLQTNSGWLQIACGVWFLLALGSVALELALILRLPDTMSVLEAQKLTLNGMIVSGLIAFVLVYALLFGLGTAIAMILPGAG